MKIHFYCPLNWFGPWDFRTPDTVGIGGSETMHIEMAWRLARRGHEVYSYGPIPDDCPREDRGVHWRHFDEADFTEPGLWVVCRHPETADKFEGGRDDQWLILICQDIDYPQAITEERVKKMHAVFGLCKAHCQYLFKMYPFLEKKIIQGSNGIRTELIRQIESEGIVRNPKRLMYASSPDRGLVNLLKIIRRVREADPQIELHVYYGMDNLEESAEKSLGARRQLKALQEWLDTDGVVYHGKTSQPDLLRAWFATGIWTYPTVFSETSCITCMEAQACGAIPVTTPYWALADNVRHGVFIPGDANNDALVRARYVETILRMTSNPDGQEQVRSRMTWEARELFGWERRIDEWESMIRELEGSTYPDGVCAMYQYAFQHAHSDGAILNVGCDCDSGNLRLRGAVNVDYSKTHPHPVVNERLPRKVDVVADARDLPESLHGRFDSVVLGDILEHMADGDIVATLRGAKACLRNGGKVIVTWPLEDGARQKVRQAVFKELPFDAESEYAPGCPAQHTRVITPEHMTSLAKTAGLDVVLSQAFEGCGDCPGMGIVLR